jgi:RNA polymerase sigma-70 factor (ECF subfamily)
MAVLSPDDRRILEGDLRRLVDAGDLAGAMTAAVKGYGPELYGFLAGMTRDHDRAGDLFSSLCEQLWKHLGSFRWESSFRVWAYAVARNEFLRSLRGAARAQKHVPISAVSSLGAAIEQVRTTTALHLRTEVKDAFARLRETLEPEDHMLLGLRVDRRMPWNDIARVLGSEPGAVEKDAAALRKRFERLKKRLRELAREHQIGEPAGD